MVIVGHHNNTFRKKYILNSTVAPTYLIGKHQYSAIGKHLKNDHSLETIGDLTNNFSVLKKCSGNPDCLFYEMLFIIKKKGLVWTHNQTPYVQIYLFKFANFYTHILLFIASHGIY